MSYWNFSQWNINFIDFLFAFQTQKPYNFTKYQMQDLSESFEAKMLQELKQETLQVSSNRKIV